jgi:hypothetical protein
MHDDDEFLRSIPPFLRRYQEPPPRKLPIRPRDLPATRSQAKSRPAPIATLMPTATAAPAAPKPAVPEVVEMAQPLAPETGAAESPVAQHARIALAFENESLDPSTTGKALGTDGEDVAFQVTLPRGVVRQIRMLAAEQGTTQRAVVLRALRLAGLSVPDGCDIDRRGRAAKQRQA